LVSLPAKTGVNALVAYSPKDGARSKARTVVGTRFFRATISAAMVKMAADPAMKTTVRRS